MTISCDVAILGGGTGGYVAAIRAAQLGKSVVVIEMDKLGGTCLHRGCIPSKSLLRSAEVYAEIQESESYGIETAGVKLVFPKVQSRKEAVVEQLHQGVQFLMRKNKIQVLNLTQDYYKPFTVKKKREEKPESRYFTVIRRN